MKATVFTGGAITDFAGDSSSDARSVSRSVMDLRTFDFISDSFVMANGLVTSAAFGSGSFGQGTGTIILGPDRAAVLLFIDSNDPAVTEVQLSGDFDHRLAQHAIDYPGDSFTVFWRLSFVKDGHARVLTFSQYMTGGQFIQLP